MGLGLDLEELASNPRLDGFVVQNLNLEPQLPFDSDEEVQDTSWTSLLVSLAACESGGADAMHQIPLEEDEHGKHGHQRQRRHRENGAPVAHARWV